MPKLSVLKKACVISVICMATAIAAPAQFTSLYSFNQPGHNPISGLIRATDGNFYGTTLVGGSAGNGSIFKITPAGALTTLYSFCTDPTNCSANGAEPAAGLVQASDGNFYGATRAHGPNLAGTIFKITPAGALTTLHAFAYDGSDGIGSTALVQGTDGDFYGETTAGGASTQCGSFGCGTIFQMTPGGTLTTLYNFCLSSSCPDGRWPQGGLIQATDGNLYGAAGGGGAYRGGTVFKITPSGTLTTLYDFCSLTGCTDGNGPSGALVQGTDGNFYGTTSDGGTSAKCGTYGCGTVFQLTPAGSLTTLHNFCVLAGCPDGSAPSVLIQASDGNFYGTSVQGGINCTLRCGTVFEITPAGTLGTLHVFDSTDGADPGAGLVQGTNGSFYGTTMAGGSYGGGTVFRLGVAPAVKLSTTSLGFGNQALEETSTARTVIVTNAGSAVLSIKSVILATSTFGISANACAGAELTLLKTCKVSLTFTPTALGKQTGTLTFADNAVDTPQKIQLSGTGIEPATLLPAAAFYGNQAVGTTSAPKIFTLTNNQNIALTNIAISTSGDFAVLATTCSTSLGAKSKCTISVSFTPTQKGKRTGLLSVGDSASNSSQTSNLTGTGLQP